MDNRSHFMPIIALCASLLAPPVRAQTVRVDPFADPASV